jgi:hypothetical protein
VNKYQKEFLKGLGIIAYIFIMMSVLINALFNNTVFWNVTGTGILLIGSIAMFFWLGRENE